MYEKDKYIIPEKTKVPPLPRIKEWWWARKTIEEQIEYTKQNVCFTTVPRIRRALLHNLGIERKNKTSENVLIFACLGLFGLARHVVNYVRLLDRLGIHYTYLPEEEHCCGWPLVEPVQGEERRKAELASRELIGMNIAKARELGAKRMYYFCVWCVHIARALFPNCDVQQMYFPDILVGKLDGVDLKVKPQTVGYYEGCHVRNRILTPGVTLDWPEYGKMLEKIKGLNVVQLRHKTCCVQQPYKIGDDAVRKGVSTIVNSCTACQSWTDRAAGHMQEGGGSPGGVRGRGEMKAILLTDLLLEALDPEAVMRA